VDIKNVMKSTV